MLQAFQPSTSFNAPLGHDQAETIGDVIADEGQERPEEAAQVCYLAICSVGCADAPQCLIFSSSHPRSSMRTRPHDVQGHGMIHHCCPI